MSKEIFLNISGRVQGVYFRVYAQKEAQALNLAGYVKNEKDGSVTIVAQGNRESLSKIFEWAKKGPSMAYVKKVKMSFRDSEESYSNFSIMR
jgi:acylphosphatase